MAFTFGDLPLCDPNSSSYLAWFSDTGRSIISTDNTYASASSRLHAIFPAICLNSKSY